MNITKKMINIKGLDKSEVLLRLWENSQAQGISFLALPDKKVKKEDMEVIIKERLDTLNKDSSEYQKNKVLYFDYLMGKVIKCNITKDEFDPWLYDRDCGEGAAEKAIKCLEVKL